MSQPEKIFSGWKRVTEDSPTTKGACSEPWLHNWGFPDYTYDIRNDDLNVLHTCKDCDVTKHEIIHGQYSQAGLLNLTYSQAKKLSQKFKPHNLEYSFEVRKRSKPGFRFWETNNEVHGTNLYILESFPGGVEKKDENYYQPSEDDLNDTDWYTMQVSNTF